MNARQVFRRGQPLAHELVVDGEDLALAPDHPEIRERRVDHLPQDHRIVPVPARHDHEVRVRRLRPVPDRLHDVPNQDVVRVRQPLRIAQRRAVIHNGDLKPALRGIVGKRSADVPRARDEADRLRQVRLEVDGGA